MIHDHLSISRKTLDINERVKAVKIQLNIFINSFKVQEISDRLHLYIPWHHTALAKSQTL